MMHFKLIILTLIFSSVYLIDSSENNATSSVQKDSQHPINHPNTLFLNSTDPNSVKTINNKNKIQPKAQDDQNEAKIFFQSYPNEVDIPESFKMGFYFFIGLSIAGILFILLKINRMRLSRAERKYGVHGDRSTQELTPLPMALEDDSENEDHTVFDINRQIRVS